MGILVYSSLLVFTAQGQTNVIAVKSQAGEMVDVLDRADNFGVINPQYEYENIDSVKYISSKKMIVNYMNYGESDTTFYTNEMDAAIFQHLKAIRLNNWYPEKTKFIGFPREIEKLAREKSSPLKNSLPIWFAIIILMSLAGNYYRKRQHS